MQIRTLVSAGDKAVKRNLFVKEEFAKAGIDVDLVNDSGMRGHRVYKAVSMSFRCVNCWTYLPAAIIAYFKGDVTKVLCYNCQKKKRS